MKEAREAADKVGGKLLLCFGGNARTGGFPGMVTSKSHRATFLKALNELLETRGFDGVDYNWEYPTNEKEWKGLVRLMKESRSEVNRGIHAGAFMMHVGCVFITLYTSAGTSPWQCPCCNTGASRWKGYRDCCILPR